MKQEQNHSVDKTTIVEKNGYHTATNFVQTALENAHNASKTSANQTEEATQNLVNHVMDDTDQQE